MATLGASELHSSRVKVFDRCDGLDWDALQRARGGYRWRVHEARDLDDGL